MKRFRINPQDRPVLVKGIHPVEEALTAGKSIEKILIQAGRQENLAGLIREARNRNIPVQFVPPAKLVQLGAAHQGIAAILATVPFYRSEDILNQVIESGKTPLFLICDRITDVRNFGAIARTAFASGVHTLIIPETEAAPVNSEAMKASAGALARIPVCRETNLSTCIRNLKLHGLKILATESKAQKFVFETELDVPLAVIVGSEGEGIQAPLLRLADELVKLPMAEPFDSYNVSVAAGMMLYEVMKQRGRF